MIKRSKTEEVIEIARTSGILRPRDLDRSGIPRVYLRRLVRKGLLVRDGSGLYTLPDAKVTENRTLAEVCKRVPNGIVCLLSALRFHGLTTQAPSQVWIALDPKAWKPKADGLPLRVVRMSGKAPVEGVKEHRIERVMFRVYNPAKTVADCFKFRNKIGLDVALEALRDYQHKVRAGMDDLWRYAKICRVARVMRPYLEALA